MRRHGSALAVTIGVIALLALLLSNLSSRTRNESRLTRTHALDSEHFYCAEGLVARVANRLKKRPWMVRYYADGGLGRGPFREETTGSFRGCTYKLWVQDVSLGEVPAVPGLVDVFVEVLLQNLTRAYHYRVGLLPTATRGRSPVRIEYLGRTAEDLGSLAGRKNAATYGTSVMLQAAGQEGVATARLSELPTELVRTMRGGKPPGSGPPQVPAPEPVSDQVIQGSDAAAVDQAQSVTRSLRTAIHLMGEDGKAFQDLLPPLERERFIRRGANHSGARVHLQAARDRAPGDLRTQVLVALLTARSLVAEGWKEGPASDRGQELIQRAGETLRAAGELYDAAPERDQAQVGPTLAATVHIDRARVVRIRRGDPADEGAAVEDAIRVAGEAGIYGGSVRVEDAIDDALEALDEDEATERIESDLPLSPSGFEPVDEDEVTTFTDDVTSGWSGWPTDSGEDQDFWDDLYDEEDGRIGEGGSGGPPPDIDRDGDGADDEDEYIEPTDTDGTPVGSGTSGGLPPTSFALIEQRVRDCDATRTTLSDKEDCMESVLESALAAMPELANGSAEFHMHKTILGSGVEVHLKIKDGDVKNTDVKNK